MNKRNLVFCLFLVLFFSFKPSECKETKIGLSFQVTEGNRIIGNIYNDMLKLKEKYPELKGLDKEALKWNYSSNALNSEGSGLKDSKLDILSIYYTRQGKKRGETEVVAYVDIFYSLNSFANNSTKDAHVSQYFPSEIYIPKLKLYLEHYIVGNQQMKNELLAIIKQNIDLNSLAKIKVQNKTKDIPQKLIRSQDFVSGYTLMLSGEAKKAVTYLQNSTKLNPADAESYGLLGDAYTSVGQYEMAEENYLKAMDLYHSQANSFMAETTARNLKKLKLKKESQNWAERKIQDFAIKLPNHFVEGEVSGGKVFRDTDSKANVIVVIIDNKPLDEDLKSVASSKYDFWAKTYYPGAEPISLLWNKSYKSHFLEIHRMENVNLKDFRGFVTKGIRKTAKGGLVYMHDYLLFKKDDNETKINIVMQSPQGYFLSDLKCDYIASTIRKL